jgi:hypothetical protein
MARKESKEKSARINKTSCYSPDALLSTYDDATAVSLTSMIVVLYAVNCILTTILFHLVQQKAKKQVHAYLRKGAFSVDRGGTLLLPPAHQNPEQNKQKKTSKNLATAGSTTQAVNKARSLLAPHSSRNNQKRRRLIIYINIILLNNK